MLHSLLFNEGHHAPPRWSAGNFCINEKSPGCPSTLTARILFCTITRRRLLCRKPSAPLIQGRTGSPEKGKIWGKGKVTILWKMSRIYHNTSLQNKPVHSEKFDRAWCPSAFERYVLAFTRYSVSPVRGQHQTPSINPSVFPESKSVSCTLFKTF